MLFYIKKFDTFIGKHNNQDCKLILKDAVMIKKRILLKSTD